MKSKRMNLSSDANGALDDSIYYIKNKDTILGSFKWLDDATVELVEDISIPSFITDGLQDWITGRTPPKHRENMESLLKQCGLYSLKSIIDYSLGLSLIDTLWITKDMSVAWKDVSLFTNEFSDVIAHIAFDGGFYGYPLSTTSPEFGTNGVLAKCWLKREDGIYLLKAGTTGAANAGNEPLSEVLASQVLDKLGYKHAHYSLEKYRGKVVSVCKSFTSESIMLQPLHMRYLFRTLDQLVSLCKKDGIERGLAEHLIFDYLSWNTDRHANNLGVLLDADTFELLDFAPIYDNGCSMLCYYTDTYTLEEYVTMSIPALYSSFEQGARIGKKILGNKHNVEKLIGFKFDLSMIGEYDVNRVLLIQKWLQSRVIKFLAM